MSSFIDFVTKDWWIAIPMFLMSFAGIGMLIWRILLNINGNVNLNILLPAVQDKLDKDGVAGALRYCRGRTEIIPRKLFVPGLETAKQGMAAQRRAMANAIELEIMPDLNFLLPSILAIAKVATMVGLFGTVISMIGTFEAIGEAVKKGANPANQSSRIGLALFATALGLITAIPLTFAHVLLKSWVAQFEVRMKYAAAKLLIAMHGVNQAGTKAAAAPAAGAAASPVKAPADATRR